MSISIDFKYFKCYFFPFQGFKDSIDKDEYHKKSSDHKDYDKKSFGNSYDHVEVTYKASKGKKHDGGEYGVSNLNFHLLY